MIDNQANADQESAQNIDNIIDQTLQNSHSIGDVDIQKLIENAPVSSKSQDNSGLLEEVVVREYAVDPEAQLSKLSGKPTIEHEKTIEERVIEAPRRKIFSFLNKPKEEPTPAFEEPQDLSTPIVPEVQGMQFREAIDTNMSATENVASQIGSTTSDFIWRNFKQGFPEIMGNYVVNISETVAEQPLIPGDLSNQIKEEINERNTTNKQKLEIPQWHEDNIKPALEAFCVEKGIQQEIPVWVQLLIGVGFMVALFCIPTIMEIKKSNKAYINRLDNLFEQYTKQAKKDKEETKNEKE